MELTYTEIEMVTDTNSNVLFNPTQQVLRGRWSPASKALRGMTSSQGMNQMPELPGMVVGIDPREKTMTLRDPLSEQENRDTLDEANRVLQGVFSLQSRPGDTVTKALDEDEYKTLIYWMRRLVDSEQARVVLGSLPTVEEIRDAVPGRIRKSFWNTGAGPDEIYEEDSSAEKTTSPKRKTVKVGDDEGDNE